MKRFSIPIYGPILFLFVCLKVFEKIDWSWWWVCSPIFISLAIGTYFMILGSLLRITADAVIHKYKAKHDYFKGVDKQ